MIETPTSAEVIAAVEAEVLVKAILYVFRKLVPSRAPITPIRHYPASLASFNRGLRAAAINVRRSVERAHA